MCGRFTVSKPVQEVVRLFQLDEPPEILRPRYNVAPGQPVAAVGLKPDGVRRGLRLLRWGLVPSWARDPKKVPNPINARAEGIADKPMFAELVESRRCLIPADGFYEWAKGKRGSRPHHFRLKDGGLFAFAGLWDAWKGIDGKPLLTCCIMTTEANALVSPLHDRMPVMLTGDRFAAWLNPDAAVPELLNLLTPFPAAEMESVAVGPAVNSVKNDGPECVEPVSRAGS